MDLTTSTSITNYLSSQSMSNLLICPYCEKDIPEIALFLNKIQMYITVKCSCLSQKIFITLPKFLNQLSNINPESKKSDKCCNDENKAKKYCPQCLLWLCNQCIESHDQIHCLIDYQLNIKCAEHKKPFAIYCKQCKINLCNSCKLKHPKTKHTLINIPEVKQPLININEIEQFMIRNKDDIDNLLARIIKSNCISNQMMNEIYLMYNNYNGMNQHLIELYRRLYSTAMIFKGLYHINRMINTIKINTTVCNLNKLNMKEKYEILKCYMQNYYVLSSNKEETSYYCYSTLNGQNVPMRNLIQSTNDSLDSKDSSIEPLDTNINKYSCTYYGMNYTPHLIQLSEDKLIANVCEHFYKIWDLNNSKCTNSGYDFNTTSKESIQLFDIKLAWHSESKQIKLCDLTKHTINTITTTNDIVCIDYLQLSDGRIAIGMQNCTIELWNISTNKCTAKLRGHTNYVTKVIQLLNGQLASASFDWTIRLWDITKKTNQCIITLKGHKNIITHLIQLSDKSLASASTDQTIKIWDLTSRGQCITTIRVDKQFCHLMQLDDGRIAYSDIFITLWDTKRLKRFNKIKRNNCETIDFFVQLKDGRLASSSAFQSYIKLWLV